MPNGSPDILLTALRTRAGNVSELATILGCELDGLREDLARLESLGFLTVTNDVITYRRPEVTVTDLAAAALSGFAAQLQNTIGETGRILDSLPGLLRAWEEGAADEHSLQIDVLHGPWAPADMWRLQFSRAIPDVSDVCMPDTSALFQVQQEYQSSFWAGRAGEPIQVRLLMSIADATNPAGKDRIRGEIDSGVQIRMHPSPPSFFWITDHDTVGIPLQWGQSWPASVMAIQSPALAAILTWIYDRIWHEAVPVTESEHPWDDMLRLMGQGLTMEAASLALGLTPRTGRRRVADAMSYYGASSHFSLGAAWGKAQ